MSEPRKKQDSRRQFLKTQAAAMAAASLAATRGVHAGVGETIKVGLIGCGGRGKGAIVNCIDASDKVKVTAVADVFQDRVNEAVATCAAKKQTVAPDQCFVGFDAFQKLLATDVDLVILATPPHFRPQHFEAAVKAGKHVFMEKPVAVDPAGCRKVIETAQAAKDAKLSVVAGTQRRHEKVYLETAKRIQDGVIGNILAARCYWNMGQLWYRNRESNWSPMEWMIRDWVNWRWLSGDHIVEQHVHNIDVVNWFTGKHPVQAVGVGGRAHRVTGDQYDYFAVDFQYDDGMHAGSYCRQVNGCDNNVSEAVIGDKGTAVTMSGRCTITPRNGEGETLLGRRIKQTDPYVQEHIDLIDSIVNGKGLNEGETIATSTLTAIMGRTAAYTGRIVTWAEMMKADDRLGPEVCSWDTELTEAVIPVAGRA